MRNGATSLVSARGHGSAHAKLAGLGSPLGTRSGSTGRRRRSGRLSLRPILPMMALKQAELGTRVDRNKGRSKQGSIETRVNRRESIETIVASKGLKLFPSPTHHQRASRLRLLSGYAEPSDVEATLPSSARQPFVDHARCDNAERNQTNS